MKSWFKGLRNGNSVSLQSSYDYIIVGGGSAGCVLANRLSADPAYSVLLLEAGKKDSSPFIRWPFGWMVIAYHKNFSWMHRTKASPAISNRRIDWPRGKVLGGSSATNGMIYIRGQAQDYDDWASQGCHGWSWQDVLPYFKKSEDYFRGETTAHGVGGEVHIEAAEGDELGDAYIASCVEAGVPFSDDFNSGDQEGVGYYHVNIKDGIRQSASYAFLKPIANRSNLTVLTEAMVAKIHFQDNDATGVSFQHEGKQHRISVDRELLLTAGCINSPQLLQLSGVGNAELLESLGIDVVCNLPGVGENLQDHLAVMVAQEIKPPITFKSQFRPDKLLRHWYRYLRYKKGIINTPAAYVGAFFKSRPELNRPDMQLHFNPASGVRKDNGASVLDKLAGVTSVVTPSRPESRGWVRITSTDVNEHPEIEANYLATEKDREDMLLAIKKQREFFSCSPIKEMSGVEIRPGAELQSDDELMQYVKDFCVTNYHPVGTCKMGSDPMAVVDTQLRVYGLGKLRVADASIMPSLISGNTNATTMMIAERAAESIITNRTTT